MAVIKPYSIVESKNVGISSLEYWDTGIIFIKIIDKVEIELSDVKIHYEFVRSKFDGTNKCCVLVDPGKFTSLTKDAREFSQRPESNEMTLATAVIIRSLAHRIVINFMINIIHQQTMKMKMFDSKEKAIEWLLSQMNK
ncbi:MAG: hypothetical protein KBG47_07510 [Bacteroidia bacterium]|nr:hypothetical protein [Sphingobacteriaceae bacterium]MBP9069336.1 hypothetical protein [Bacteroidia bacterium]